MKNTANLSRRHFLRTTGQAATALAAVSTLAPAVLSASSPGKTIGVGCIGLGTRGGDLINAVANVANIKVTAVCDVYEPHRQKGIERSLNPAVKAYVDYRELLADRNVDAVVIATPDHWHCRMVLDAVKAGKDIYCEKGLARTLNEAKLMRDALKQSGVVFQLGHHARQAACALQAKELLAKDILGPVTLVHGRFKALPPGHPNWRWYGYYDQWDRPDPAKVAKEVNWDLWLGPAPKIPWNERHFWHWRCYWAYGTGYAGDLLSHEMDFVQYLLGHGVPDTCTCTGMISQLKDDREVPDTWSAIYEFEKLGRTVTFTGSMNTSRPKQPVEICGRDATLRFDDIAHDVTRFQILPEEHNTRTDLPKGYEGKKTPKQPNHMEDWVNCIQSRGTPKCSTDEAFIEAATSLMSLISYQQRRQVRWDAVREEIV